MINISQDVMLWQVIYRHVMDGWREMYPPPSAMSISSFMS